jgi:hypothetical protein
LKIGNNIFIVNKVGLGRGQALQDTIVYLFHSLFIFALALNQLVLAVFELHLHSLNDDTGKLLFKTFLLHCEVHKDHFGCDFRLVFRIWQFGSHE